MRSKEWSGTGLSVILRKDTSNVRRVLVRLKNKGLVFQGITKLWSVSQLGLKVLISILDEDSGYDKKMTKKPSGSHSNDQNFFSSTPTSLKRGHAMRVRFPIKSCPRKWRESPKKMFEKEGFIYNAGNLKNVDDVNYTVHDCFVKATTRSFIANIENIYYDHPSELLVQLRAPIRQLRRSINQRFNRLGITLENHEILEWGEIAHENDLLNKIASGHGVSYDVIKHSDGKARVKFDKSHGFLELEFLHPGMQDSDSDQWERRKRQIVKVLDSGVDYDDLAFSVEKSALNLGEMKDIMSQVVKDNFYHKVNIESHIDAIRDLGQGIEKYNSGHDKLFSVIASLAAEIKKLKK